VSVLARYLQTRPIVVRVPLRWRVLRALRWPVISSRWVNDEAQR
jgi:hypothetical protein